MKQELVRALSNKIASLRLRPRIRRLIQSELRRGHTEAAFKLLLDPTNLK